ncbi:hypothetical protein PV396_28415 [Streptomyces sp. ME02-8801-2C]|nr:hypothetical protein [Streptomyces sp. ME02-8801-2C]MDX3455817.1 hypothetical protein [Streptomyces sp. ME02-8801-2C]
MFEIIERGPLSIDLGGQMGALDDPLIASITKKARNISQIVRHTG